MEKSAPSSSIAKPRRGFFRKQLIMPAEHGSWSWLLVPYFVGILVAGEWNLAAFLVLLGALAGFLVRQPATVAMRARTGRGRKADGGPALIWAIILSATAFASFLGLLARSLALPASLTPLAVLWLAAYSNASQRFQREALYQLAR